MGGIPDPYRIDPGPMREWLTERAYSFELNEYAASPDALGAGAHLTPRQRLLRLLDWDDPKGAGDRRLHRWLNESDVIDRRDVEEALHNAGVDWFDVYPAPEDAIEDEDAEEEFCFACRAFVTPIAGCCAWCDRPVQRIDLRNLPPRPVDKPVDKPAPEQVPLMHVCHRPRKPHGTARIFDTDLARRRRALEAFAVTGSYARAGAAVWEGAFSSASSAENSLRGLVRREGWHVSSGARGEHAKPDVRLAARHVAEALSRGTWNRVPERVPGPSRRWVMDELLVREAAFMYFVDESSFREVARRLLPRSGTTVEVSLQRALRDEWNRRGWPRRSLSASSSWTKPTGDRRCRERRVDGKRCGRWAQKGKTLCFDHDPERAQEARERNVRASKIRFADVVPVDPFAYWIRHRIKELGSLRAFHRRVDGAVSYESLSRWAHPWGEVGRDGATVVQRSTVDRILAAWGGGTTFEDVYLPTESDDAGLVPEAIAA